MRRALGKGLSQLIGEQAEGNASEVAVTAIQPSHDQPRTVFDAEALQELAESIREVGVLQPLIVRPLRDGQYELIAGERRWRAAQLAGLQTVPVIVRAASNRETLVMALIENLQREEITSVETARAYRRLVQDFELTQEEVAMRVGKTRSSVTNTMRLLRLPAVVLEALEQGNVTEGQVRPLIALETEAEQLALFDEIVKKGLSAREVERRLKPKDKPARITRSVVGPTDPNWRALQERAQERFGTPVKLEGSEKGGKITFAFYSEEDLVRIMELLGVEF